MKRLVSILFKAHKYTGIFISAFFLMWFVTGIVLIYHPYPRVSEQLCNSHKEVLPSSLPELDWIGDRVEGDLQAVKIRQFQGQTLIDVKTKDKKAQLTTDTLQEIKPVDFKCVVNIARGWTDAPVAKVDTLHRREQWVLYSKYDKELPIYKFHFDDKDKTELFISGQSAQVLQLTTRKERFWAYVGAIPHKLYFPFIRRNTDAWMDTVVVGGSVCFAAALTGFLYGLYLFFRRKRVKGKFGNPFKKRWQRIHFSFGLVFGLFTVAWGISGIFSMSRVPQWIIRTEAPFTFNKTRLWGKGLLPADTYKLGFNKVKEAYPQLKEITLARFADIPAYIIIEGENERYLNASSDEVEILQIPESTIVEGFGKMYGKDVPVKVSLLEEYDNYYVNLRGTYTLPVYKVEVDNNDKELYYVSPDDGYIKYLNKNKKADKWLFSAIHYLNIPWLITRRALWTICMWVLCGGCAMVCLSGVILGIKSLLKRK